MNREIQAFGSGRNFTDQIHAVYEPATEGINHYIGYDVTFSIYKQRTDKRATDHTWKTYTFITGQ